MREPLHVVRPAPRDAELLAAVVDASADFVGLADLNGEVWYVNAAGRRLVGFGDRPLQGVSLLDFVHRDDQAVVREEVLPLLRGSGRWHDARELRLRHWRTGRRISALVDAFRVDDPRTGAPVALATVARDVTAVRHELVTRARQQAAVAALGMRTLGERDVQAALDAAVETVAATLRVPRAAVAELLPDEDTFVLRAGVGWDLGAVGRLTAPRAHSLAGHAITSGRPVVSVDLANDDRFRGLPLVADDAFASAIAVVVEGRNGCYGVLCAFARRPRQFTDDDVNFVQSVANVVGSAIEVTRADAAVAEVREAERRRIARDLHDDALQALAAATAEARGSGASERLVELLADVRRHVRGAIYDLRLEGEDGDPFEELLRTLGARYQALAPELAIEVDVAPGTPEPDRAATAELLRIVGEAVANACRHAGARTIRISARGEAARLVLEVVDDGGGFDPRALEARPESTGLHGMRERAALLDADLLIDTRPGRGTLVRVVVAAPDGAPERGPTRVLLVEDQAVVRESLAAMFEREPDFGVVGQAGSLAEARTLLEGVDVAIIDLGLPDGTGSELIPELRAASPRAQALILSATVDRAATARAVRDGAAAVVDKVEHLGEVVDAVRRVRNGETLIPIHEISELLQYARRRTEQERADRTAIASLTPREREVLQALADGLDAQAIAERLHITLRTERNHMANILAKLRVHSQLQALVLCLRYGVVSV